MNVVFEDNHIIIVSKRSGEIVQGDKTGDRTLADEVKAYIKEKYAKPGNVFLGIAHRLDRPVWGLVAFAKTSKALARLNDMFRNGDVKKNILGDLPEPSRSAGSHANPLADTQREAKQELRIRQGSAGSKKGDATL